MFEYFVRRHICLSVSVDVAFYFKLGFGREGRGFESGSWVFWGFFFLGGGEDCDFKNVGGGLLGVGVVFTLIS